MALSGSKVVEKHKKAMKECDGKTSWSLLECIVDEMHKEYKA